MPLRVIMLCNTCLAAGTQELFERLKEEMNDEPLITLLFFSIPTAGFMLAGPGPFLHPSCLLVGRVRSGYS